MTSFLSDLLSDSGCTIVIVLRPRDRVVSGPDFGYKGLGSNPATGGIYCSWYHTFTVSV